MKKILLFIKLPPPTTGATLMNQYVADSKLLKDYFDIHTIGISYAQSVGEMGKIKFSKFFTIIKTYFRLVMQLIAFKPDLIYFQISPLGFAFIRDSLYVFLMKLFQKKIVFHIHGKGISNNIKNPIKKWYYRKVFNNTEVICLSNMLTYDIKHIFGGKIHIVPNGIQKANIAISISKNNNDARILFLSNLIESKGVYDYIEALSIVKKCNISFSAYIVGKEGDVSIAELNKSIDEKKLKGYLEYLGPVYGNEKFKILNNCDIFIHPTQKDVWGLVILEAMQCSLPVISTFEGAISEMVEDGVTGFLVNKKSPKEIADKLELLIKDDDLRQRMGKAGREKFLKYYTIEKFEENMKNVFDDIFDRMNGEKNV